jgi:hypothetical protein
MIAIAKQTKGISGVRRTAIRAPQGIFSLKQGEMVILKHA